MGNFNFVEKNIRLTFFFLFYSLLKKPSLKKTKISTKVKKNKKNFWQKRKK